MLSLDVAHQAGRQLDHPLPHGGAVLLDQHQPPVPVTATMTTMPVTPGRVTYSQPASSMNVR